MLLRKEICPKILTPISTNNNTCLVKKKRPPPIQKKQEINHFLWTDNINCSEYLFFSIFFSLITTKMKRNDNNNEQQKRARHIYIKNYRDEA